MLVSLSLLLYHHRTKPVNFGSEAMIGVGVEEGVGLAEGRDEDGLEK